MSFLVSVDNPGRVQKEVDMGRPEVQKILQLGFVDVILSFVRVSPAWSAKINDLMTCC